MFKFKEKFDLKTFDRESFDHFIYSEISNKNYIARKNKFEFFKLVKSKLLNFLLNL